MFYKKETWLVMYESNLIEVLNDASPPNCLLGIDYEKSNLFIFVHLVSGCAKIVKLK